MTTALLLIAHGSRNPEANEDLAHVARELRRRDLYPIIEIAYLEIAQPTIPEGGRRCVEAGARRVILVPYFLSPGVHARDDLQAHRDQLAAAHAEAEFLVAEPLGRHPLLIEIVLERARQASRG
ncbi:MAG: CbiX/SirB N-terminal domain-containing protein [Gemmataceae bacterium]|nr:CbiX/SirB N-terminal domain-containing protein [Gemmataceae bacterium]